MRDLVGGRSRYGGVATRLLAAAVTFLTAATLAASALAMPAGPDSVRPGKNITVFHNSDFVAVFGHAVGERLTVDVYRGPNRIASAFGPAVSTPEGGGLEVNHGPEGQAVQGDCWDGHTPDILPGDRIVVTDGSGGKDEAIVDDIAITTGPVDDTSTADTTDVILEGRASFADGTPIPVERLDSGELRHDGPRFRATPNTVERIPGTADGWRATYKHPYTVVQIKEALTAQERKQAILNGYHAMGYGHAVPLPSETQIAERPAAGGPALDCGNPASPFYAPKQANAVTTSDDRFVNLGSGDLKLGGTAAPDVTAVRVTLSDGDAATADITVDATGLTEGPGEKGWSAEIPRARIEDEDLADGPLTATGAFETPDGSVTGATKEIIKDTLQPAAPSANPEPKLYNRAQNVSLQAEDEADILYTFAPSPAPPATRYAGPIPVGASTSIRAIVVDRAGNPGPEASFDYTIDTVAPSVDVDLDAASDSGASNSDNLTNVASPTFRGTTEAGAKVELLVDGTKKGETTAGSDGSYTLRVANPATGNRSVVARATDPAGNSQSSAPLVVRIDRTDPSVRGAPAPGTYDTARQVRLAANEAADIFYTLGATDPTVGSTRFTTPISVTASRTIKALAVDRAGNTGGVASLSYTIRRDSFVNLRLSTANLTLGASRAISGKVSPAHAGVRLEMDITRDGAPVATRFMRLDGQSAFATSYRPLTTGLYRVTVRFAGDADSKPSSTTKSFRVVW